MKRPPELMERFGLEETLVEVVKRTRLRWMGLVFKREYDKPVKRACDLVDDGIRGKFHG